MGSGALPLGSLRWRQAPEPTPQTILSARHRRRILVVDDNQDSAESLTLLLRAAGHEASLATDGPGALRMAQDLQAKVVFLDIGMPASAAALSELLASVMETSRGQARPNGGRKSGRRSSSVAAE